MEITTQSLDSVTVAHLTGELDSRTSAVAQGQLAPLVSAGSRLVLDMSGVDFMSSAGLRLMLSLYRQATSLGGHIVLAGLSPELVDTMSATGFLASFKTSETVDEAVAALRSAS